MKLTNRRCQCAACKKYFNTVSAFDKHRTGRHRNDTRRCRTTEEMTQAGMFCIVKGSEYLWYGSRFTQEKIGAIK